MMGHQACNYMNHVHGAKEQQRLEKDQRRTNLTH